MSAAQVVESLHVVKRSGKRQKYTNNKIERYLKHLSSIRPHLNKIDTSEISKEQLCRQT